MSDVPVLKYVSGKMSMDARIYIVLDYMPPFPSKDTVPEKVVVWCPDSDCFLRFEDDPLWDVYGSDYETVERALAALKKAPEPRKPYVEFTFPVNRKSDDIGRTK